MAIYVLSPDVKEPTGGVKQLYRHVDILNRHGVSACILHQQEGFRCTWFENRTEVRYLKEVRLERGADVFVIPEICGPDLSPMGNFATGVDKVIFNQNCFYTFTQYGLDPRTRQTPYLDDEVVAALVVSEDSGDYLRYAFPDLNVLRVRHGIDPGLFSYAPEKKPLIAFMPAKNIHSIEQVINLLKFRGALDGYDLVSIANRREADVARTLREASVFLSFGTAEGFGMPPAEAMSCGCIVVGWHGMGGKEFFEDAFSYPVPIGDVLAFAKTAEGVLSRLAADPSGLDHRRAAAAQFIRDHYSLEQEEQSVLGCWETLLGSGRLSDMPTIHSV